MKKFIYSGLMLASMLFTSTVLTSCLGNDDETIVLEKTATDTGIPDDADATPNPEIWETTTTIPNIQTTVDYINGVPIIRLDITGIKNSDDAEWMRLYGTNEDNQNVWVEVDGKAKGILVYNNADNKGTESILVDVVFTVDNSGSMSEEADAIARDITTWAQQLVNAGLNARFGVVGYGGYIDGAIDLTTVDELSSYLNLGYGVSRTKNFGGAHATQLSNYANSFPRTSNYDSDNECGAMAIEFADKYFSFRSGTNHIYVNFTDEPNQPKGITNYSVRYFEDQTNWPASKGTVHTVYSDTRFSTNNWNSSEQPWLISEYTGGTTIFTSSSFSGVTLSSLPVTGAMENSYIIRFTNIEEFMDGQAHLVHITVLSQDGRVQADKIFTIVFGTL